MSVGMFQTYQPYQPYFYLNLLYDQHRYYTNFLSECHQTLHRKYERLAKTETEIAQRHESQMVRKQKKQLQWSRAKTKRSIRDLERQEYYLQDRIRECERIMGGYASGASMNGSPVPAPQLRYPVTPFSAISAVQRTAMIGDCKEPTKYWNLSMLYERGGSVASMPSADSGFYEPSVFAQPIQRDSGGMSSIMGAIPKSTQPRQDSFNSERDAVGELGTMASPMKLGAEVHVSKHHQRRYSENAIQRIESRLASPKGHNRVRSVGQIPSFDRVMWNR